MSTMLRILVDGPLPGAENMAIDEAILQNVNEGHSPATLRFYQWNEPTISLGYFQKYDEYKEQDKAINTMPVVRRQTGGGAILHHDELTYSIILPLDSPCIETIPNIEDLYTLVHDCYIEVLTNWGIDVTYRGGDDRGNAQRGPFFCFSRGHRLDLVIGPDKLVGSAQRRIKNAVLQHGSLILRKHFNQQESAEIAQCENNQFTIDGFIEKVSALICGKLKLVAETGELTGSEKNIASDLLDKYAGEDWNCQR